MSGWRPQGTTLPDGSVTPAKFAVSAIDPAAATPGARTLGTGAAQAAAGNDARLSDARTPLAHTHPQADVTGLVAALAGKAALVHTHAQADVTGLVAALALANKRALFMGRAGAISPSVTDGADFLVQVPHDMTIERLRVTTQTAPSGAMSVQLRRSTNPTTPSFTNVTGFAAVFTAAQKSATVAPTSVDVNEGDILNFSVVTGSGANLLVEAIGRVR